MLFQPSETKMCYLVIRPAVWLLWQWQNIWTEKKYLKYHKREDKHQWSHNSNKRRKCDASEPVWLSTPFTFCIISTPFYFFTTIFYITIWFPLKHLCTWQIVMSQIQCTSFASFFFFFSIRFTCLNTQPPVLQVSHCSSFQLLNTIFFKRLGYTFETYLIIFYLLI